MSRTHPDAVPFRTSVTYTAHDGMQGLGVLSTHGTEFLQGDINADLGPWQQLPTI